MCSSFSLGIVIEPIECQNKHLTNFLGYFIQSYINMLPCQITVQQDLEKSLWQQESPSWQGQVTLI